MVYDYSQIEKVFCCGDIHGEFKTFFNKIKQQVSTTTDIEGVDDDHPLVIEEKQKNEERGGNITPRPMFVFQGNGFKKRDTYNNSVIFVTGDCGFGFNKPQYYVDLLTKYNKLFESTNTTIFFIRGNHDDAAYFDGEMINFSHIKAIHDYSVVKTQQLSTLCVGGAISIDRLWRKQHEVLINKYKKHSPKKLYWENEAFVFDETQLNELLANGITIDSVITHSAPKFAPPTSKKDIGKWIKLDKNLKHDIDKERNDLTKLHTYLVQNKQILRFWSYGHFHQFTNTTTENDGTTTVFLGCADNFQIMSPLEEIASSRPFDMSTFDWESLSIQQAPHHRVNMPFDVGRMVEALGEVEGEQTQDLLMDGDAF